MRVEYLGVSANEVVTINFVIAAIFAGAGGALALMALGHIDPQFSYWTTSGEFVFVAILAGYQSVAAVFVASLVLELVRSFSNLYFPNTWQLVLGVFLLVRHSVPAARHRLALGPRQTQTEQAGR